MRAAPMIRSCVMIPVVSMALAASSAAAENPVVFSKPGLISSIGQSSDIAVVKVLLNTKLKLGLEVKPLAQPQDLEGQKTLILVVGASTKGLGAAGLDTEKEVERTKALLATAAAAGIRILAMHTGGESRRGRTTNDFINLVVPRADYVIVVASGNQDRIFQQAARSQGTPIAEVDNLMAAGDAVKVVFQE